MAVLLHRAKGVTTRELARLTEQSLEHTIPLVNRLALAGWVEARAGELPSDPQVWRLTPDARAVLTATL